MNGKAITSTPNSNPYNIASGLGWGFDSIQAAYAGWVKRGWGWQVGGTLKFTGIGGVGQHLITVSTQD
jgi:hypothetical protein